MCKASPADAGAQLRNVACPVLVIEGSLDPDWADPRARVRRSPTCPLVLVLDTEPHAWCPARLPAGGVE